MEWIEALAAKKHKEACEKADKRLHTLDELVKKARQAEEIAGHDALKFNIPADEIGFLLGCAPRLGRMDYFEVLEVRQKASALNSSLPGELAKQLQDTICAWSTALKKSKCEGLM